MVFSDIQNHWAKESISKLKEQNIVSGYPNGTFRPDKPVTRAEFAALIGMVYPQAQKFREPIPFRDVPDNHWAKRDIEIASAKGFFTGYPDGTFRPEREIPRVQALVVLASRRDFFLPLNTEEILKQYFDDRADIPNYAKKAIAVAAIEKIVVNYPQVRKLNPNRSATRGEIAAFICQALKIPDAVNSEYIAKNNLLVIPPQFKDANPFSDELALVSIDGKTGYIDETGKFAISPNPELGYLGNFSEGLALVSVQGKAGYIDKTGNLAIETEFSSLGAGNFSEELARFKSNTNFKWGYIDRFGNSAIDPQFDSAGDFSEEIALVKVDSNWGYIDKKGKFVIQPEFAEAGNFSEGLARAKSQESGYKWGYIDLDKNWVIEPQFSKAEDFSEGLALVFKDGSYSYIDRTNKVILQPKYGTDMGSFSEGLARIGIGLRKADRESETADEQTSQSWGFMDKKGNLVIHTQFDDVYDFSNGLAWVLTDAIWDAVPRHFTVTGDPYEFVWVLKSGKWSFISNPLL